MLLVLFAISQESYALFGYDEFTDDSPQLIQETVEDANGVSGCSTCNMSIKITYPNGSRYGSFYMTYNISASKWQKRFNLTLVNRNTTIYGVTLNGTLTSGNKLNATSDRTQITIYDIFPPADSQWDVGITLILIGLAYIFLMLFINLNEEHNILKWIFAALALGMNMILFRLADRIVFIQGITSASFISFIQVSGSISIYATYIFTIYMLVYILYYVISNAYYHAKQFDDSKRMRFRS